MKAGNNETITWYVFEPRDQPCWQVNPRLWKVFSEHHQITERDDLYTEAYCVQWLDLNTDGSDEFKERSVNSGRVDPVHA